MKKGKASGALWLEVVAMGKQGELARSRVSCMIELGSIFGFFWVLTGK